MEQPSIRSVNLRIFPAVSFTFIAYFAIGLPLAILPAYVHLRLGRSAVLAGLMVSLQYIATFASRHRTGHMSDTIGPRQTVRYGMIACATSGALMTLSFLLRHFLWVGLGTLALSRLALGTGESMGATGATMWGIGRVGHEHTARVISWNGVATYVGLAIGAPIGVLVESRWGFAAVGAILLLLGIASFAVATRMAPTIPPKGEPVPLGRLLRGVSPFGLALALGGMGFGVIATFITLYFAQRHWQGAALSLSLFGLCFVGARLAFARFINRFGGFPVAIVSFLVEAAGLVLLALGHSQILAYLGSGMTGLGFSLIFPAMAVEAANTFPASVRGSVLGVYSAFVDGSLFLAGPLAGIVIVHFGYTTVFLATAGAVLVALAGTLWLASAPAATTAS
jgi:MFS family permease